MLFRSSLPAPHVLVLGDTPVARALSTLGTGLDLDVELVTDGVISPVPGDAAVIIASHGQDEEPALTAALAAGVPYIALVASARRAAGVLASLDVDDDARQRIHSPAGLAIGARTPAETALAILAEFTALRAESRNRRQDAEPAQADQVQADRVQAPQNAQAVDPVCGMHVSTTGTPLQAEVNGVLSYFCSSGCRNAYVSDPLRYAALS